MYVMACNGGSACARHLNYQYSDLPFYKCFINAI